MDYLSIVENSSDIHMYISILIFIISLGYIIYSTSGFDIKNKLNKKEEARLSKTILTSLDNMKVFKELNDEVLRLERALDPKTENNRVAFNFAGKGKEIIGWLNFLESKNAKIISANNDIVKQGDKIELSGTISVLLEDDNGVIYIIILVRDKTFEVSGLTLTEYQLPYIFVLKEDKLQHLKDDLDPSDLFIPREKHGEPEEESRRKTHICEDVDNDRLTLTLFWNKQYNVKLHFGVDQLLKEVKNE